MINGGHSGIQVGALEERHGRLVSELPVATKKTKKTNTGEV